jgi:uncharacterized protein
MNIIKKIKSIEKIFSDLNTEINLFKVNSGLRCPDNCCFCCKTDNIEATILEFLPIAYYLHKIGMSEFYFNKLEKFDLRSICIFCNDNFSESKKSGCEFYQYRGLICRLFGFSGKKDKYNKPMLITCQKIKNTYPEQFSLIEIEINSGLEIPILRNYYLMLYGIDYSLSDKMYPINQAIKYALNIIMFNEYYKKAS